MAKKEFTYRGFALDKLQQMSIKEFAQLAPSRERRTLLRGQTDAEKSLLRKLAKRDSAKTHAREMVVVPQMVGKTALVHNGKEYVPVAMTEEMVGMRLGQFVLTRKMVKHTAPGVGAAKASKDVSVK
nr:ribosomal protein S19 [uncultured archaeon]